LLKTASPVLSAAMDLCNEGMATVAPGKGDRFVESLMESLMVYWPWMVRNEKNKKTVKIAFLIQI
jgi:hypothetical protein